MLRYIPEFGPGELGGTKTLKYVSFVILVLLWLMYVLLSAFQTRVGPTISNSILAIGYNRVPVANLKALLAKILARELILKLTFSEYLCSKSATFLA